MRIILTAAALGSLAALTVPILPSSAADAQRWYGDRGHRGDIRRAQRECRRDLRRADSRREYRRELRDCRRDLARARHGNYDRYYGYRDGRRYGYRDRRYYSWRYR